MIPTECEYCYGEGIVYLDGGFIKASCAACKGSGIQYWDEDEWEKLNQDDYDD